MCRHRENGSHLANFNSLFKSIITEHVHDILHTCKAQAYEYGIHYTVEIFIKILTSPYKYHEYEKFGQLFRNAGFPERRVKHSIAMIKTPNNENQPQR